MSVKILLGLFVLLCIYTTFVADAATPTPEPKPTNKTTPTPTPTPKNSTVPTPTPTPTPTLPVNSSVTPTPTPTSNVTSTPSPKGTPWYEEWWFWGTIAGVCAALILLICLALILRSFCCQKKRNIKYESINYSSEHPKTDARREEMRAKYGLSDDY